MSENPRIVATCAVRSLDAITEPFVRAILDHHSAVVPEYGSMVYCNGCDMGCSCEAAEWPCSTVALIAQRYDIDMPEVWRIGWRGPIRDARVEP